MICSIHNCGRRSIARGWCSLHYQRWRQYGDPTRTPPSEADRFHASYVVDRNGCWIWQQSTIGQGYGGFRVGSTKNNTRRRAYAHRYSWELHNNRQVPNGMLVCHHCDIPLCVNPAHLFLGTSADNFRDSKRKNRHAHGERANAKLTKEQALEIIRSPESNRELARRFGIGDVQVSRIKHGLRWRHLHADT